MMRLLLSSLSLIAGFHTSAPAAPSPTTTITDLAFVAPLTGERRYRWDKINSVGASGRSRCAFGNGLHEHLLLDLCFNYLCDRVLALAFFAPPVGEDVFLAGADLLDTTPCRTDIDWLMAYFQELG